MPDPKTSRRTFLRGAAGLGGATLIPTIGWAAAGAPHYLNAAGLPDGSYWLLGLTEDGAETFRLPLPDRGHAAAAHPERPEAVAFARRPGTFAVVIDCAEGREIAQLHTPRGPPLLRPRRLHPRRHPALHHRERHRARAPAASASGTPATATSASARSRPAAPAPTRSA